MLSYDSIASLVEAAEKEGKKISEVVLADQAADMGLSEEEVFAKMDHDVDVMIEAVQFGKRKDQKSTSGLTGGEGYKMDVYSTETKGGLSGNIVSRAMMRALSVSGCNASMGAHRGYADGRQLRHHALAVSLPSWKIRAWTARMWS